MKHEIKVIFALPDTEYIRDLDNTYIVIPVSSYGDWEYRQYSINEFLRAVKNCRLTICEYEDDSE